MPISVVAIDREDNNRFTYRGHSKLREGNTCTYPFGILLNSTDVFSHILLTDIITGSIHMVDENGQFLSFLMINDMVIWAIHLEL